MPTLRERTEGFTLDSWRKPENQRFILRDRVRLSKFKEALEKTVTSQSVVIDIGAGWGVLSIFAAKAGAKKVFAIEAHEVNIEKAKKEIAKERLGQKIELIRGDSFEIPREALPQANVIVSETLGFMGIGEGIVGIMHDAKLKWLSKNSMLIPRRLSLYIASVSVPHPPKKRMMMLVSQRYLHSKPRIIEQYELGNDKDVSNLDVPPNHVGWFVAELHENIVLDTSPFSPSTSWEQIYFP